MSEHYGARFFGEREAAVYDEQEGLLGHACRRPVRLAVGGGVSANKPLRAALEAMCAKEGAELFIPPVGPTVTVDGEVRRPAIYEVTPDSTVADVVQLAGGLNPEADSSKAALTRIDEQRNRVVMAVNLRYPWFGWVLFEVSD